MKEYFKDFWERLWAPFLSIKLAYKKFPQLFIPLLIWMTVVFSSTKLFNFNSGSTEINMVFVLSELLFFGLIVIVSFHFNAIMLVQMIRNIETSGKPKVLKSFFAVFYGRSLIMIPVLFMWVFLYLILGIAFIFMALVSGRTKSDIGVGSLSKILMLVVFFGSYLYVFLLPPVIFNGFNLKKSGKEIKTLLKYNHLKIRGGTTMLAIAFIGVGYVLVSISNYFLHEAAGIYIVLGLFMFYFQMTLIFISEKYLSALKFVRLQEDFQNHQTFWTDWESMEKPLIGDEIAELA